MEKIYFIKHEKQLIAIKIEDVHLIEAMRDYVKIHTPKTSYVILSTMKEVLSKLPQNDYARVHNSYIVRLDKIISIEGSTMLVNKQLIPVSRDRFAELKDRIVTL